MKQFNSEETHGSDKKFTEGITAMMVGLTMVILGATALGLPRWTAAIFIPAGLASHILGLRWYRQSYGQFKKGTELLGKERTKEGAERR